MRGVEVTSADEHNIERSNDKPDPGTNARTFSDGPGSAELPPWGGLAGADSGVAPFFLACLGLPPFPQRSRGQFGRAWRLVL